MHLRSPRALAAVLLLPAMVLGVLASSSCAYAQRIKPSFWGLHAMDWTALPSDLPVGAANFTTTGTYWSSIETAPGVYDFSRLDQQVAAAEAHGAQPMIILGRTPQFRSSKPRAINYYAYMPADLAGWKAYVTEVARTYGSRLDYQIWPEPNISGNWTTGCPRGDCALGSPRQMAQLTMVASKAIKHVDRRAKVIAPASALRLAQQRRWMTQYFKQRVGGKPVAAYVDAVALDPFPEQRGTPEDSFRLMAAARAQLAALGIRKPLWNNEINYGVVGANAPTKTRYSAAKQQAYVIRTYALSAAARMQRTYWLGWFHSDGLGIQMADTSGNEMAAGRAYRVARSWLNGTRFQGCASERGSGVWVCTAKRGTEVRRVYWKARGKAAIRTPRTTKRIETQNGASVPGRVKNRTLRVSFKPVLVVSAR